MIAVCQTHYSNIHSEARHASELVSQLLRGEPVVVTSEEGEWCRIETSHGYEGFARSAHLAFPSSGWFQRAGLPKICMGQVWENRNSGFPFLPGSFLWEMDPIPEDTHRGWNFHSLESFKNFRPKEFTESGIALIDIPYVWGGKTPLGLDCSGLVQHLFHLQGFDFPRDAWQQAESGEVVSEDPEFPFEPGDLLFFRYPGKKVHHVAISLGGSRYLHSSEWVRTNSLDPNQPDFAMERKETFRFGRRIQTIDLRPLRDAFQALLKKEPAGNQNT